MLEGADLDYARSLLPLRGAFCSCDVGLDHLTGQLLIPDPSEPEQPGRSACFFIDKDILCFVDEGDLCCTAIDTVRASYTDQGSTRERFLACMLGTFLRGHGQALEKIERHIRGLEECILREEKPDDFTQQVSGIRRRLLALHEFYDEMDDMLEDLLENENGFLSQEGLPELRALDGRVERLINRSHRLIDDLQQLRAAWHELMTDRQSEAMDRLTVISAVFLPLTLITGWFGMNFEHMPELKHGYPYVIGGCLVLVAVMLWILRKRHIL